MCSIDVSQETGLYKFSYCGSLEDIRWLLVQIFFADYRDYGLVCIRHTGSIWCCLLSFVSVVNNIGKEQSWMLKLPC